MWRGEPRNGQVPGLGRSLAASSVEYPVNIAIEGNEKIVASLGVAGALVSRLTSITAVRPGQRLAIELIDGVRYFGHAISPGEVVDLIGYNANGGQDLFWR
jgi:hypothetical protein